MSTSSGSNGRHGSSVELWEDLSSELWQVKHAGMPAKTVTLDQLDAAFKRDDITTHTLVRKVGSLKWQTLAEVAGIEPFLSPAGDIRTLPSHWPDADPRMAGIDGFYAARLERI